HRLVALPSLVLEFDVRDGHGVGVRVEIGQGLILGDPATEDVVSDGYLAGLVVDLNNDVLAEILERHFGAEAGAEVPDLVRPLLELGIVGHAALEGDGLVLGTSRRLARAARIAPFAVLDDVGGALQTADL